MRDRNIVRYALEALFIVFVAVILVISLYPFFWMILNSFKTNLQIFQSPMKLPTQWKFAIFARAWKVGKFSQALYNSSIVTASVVLITLIASSMAAFATSHLQFKGRNFFLSMVIGAQVVSGQVVLVPIFKLLKDMSLVNSRAGLILLTTAFSVPMSVFMFNGFFRSLPKEIYESIKIDGSSNLRYYAQILIPLSTPIISSVAIFQAMFCWNEYLFALTFLRSADLLTIPPLLRNFFSSMSLQYNLIFAGLSLVVIPILLLYVFLQRNFITGLTAGAVKG